MDVAVDGHGGADFIIALQAADGDGNVVDHAESFTMVRKGVVESAANADADSVYQALTRSQDRSAGGEPECIGEFLGVGDLHFHFFALGERPCFQLLHVLGLVDQEDVLIAGGLWLEKVFRAGDTGGDQAVADAAVLFGGKDVIADGKVIGVAIDQLEGEHQLVCREKRLI